MDIHGLRAHLHIQKDPVKLLFGKVCASLPGIVEQQAGDRLAEQRDLGGLHLCPGEIIDLKLRGFVLNAAALREQDGGHRRKHGPDDQQFLPAERPQPGKKFFHHCASPCQNRTVSRPFALR